MTSHLRHRTLFLGPEGAITRSKSVHRISDWRDFLGLRWISRDCDGLLRTSRTATDFVRTAVDLARTVGDFIGLRRMKSDCTGIRRSALDWWSDFSSLRCEIQSCSTVSFRLTEDFAFCVESNQHYPTFIFGSRPALRRRFFGKSNTYAVDWTVNRILK